MKAVVTGAAGFIGSHLVENLLNDEVSVVGVDDERTGDWTRVNASCDQVKRDLASFSESEFTDLFEDVDVVYHLAAEKYNSSRATPERVIETNVAATARLFRAAATRCAHVVFTSSLYAYGSRGPKPMSELDVLLPDTVYGASKAMGEYLLRSMDREGALSWATARLFFVYGPRQFAEGGYKSVIVKNFERLRSGLPPVIVGDGEQQLDYVYIDDVIDALRQLGNPSLHRSIINIGSGRGVSINEITQRMNDIAEYRGPALHEPPDWTAHSRRIADISLATSVLEWSPQPIDEGLEKVWRELGK